MVQLASTYMNCNEFEDNKDNRDHKHNITVSTLTKYVLLFNQVQLYYDTFRKKEKHYYGRFRKVILPTYCCLIFSLLSAFCYCCLQT